MSIQILRDEKRRVQIEVTEVESVDERITFALPENDTILDTKSRYYLRILCDALVEYHNAPILIYETESKTEPKKEMLGLGQNITDLLDTSKIRGNHIFGIRSIIVELQFLLSQMHNPSAQELNSALSLLDSKFFQDGKNPNTYVEWDRADQIRLMQSINPHIKRLLRDIKRILTSPVEEPVLTGAILVKSRQ